MHTQNSVHKTRFNTLMSQPKKIKFKLAVVQFSLPALRNQSIRAPEPRSTDYSAKRSEASEKQKPF